ncbi:hypothetical protein GCM10028807_60540 [Spirosoma daeguense]
MATYDAYDPYDGATQYQSNQQQNQPQQPSQQAEESDDTSGKSLNSDQKKAIVAAGVGTAALGAAAYGLSMLEDSENSELADGEGDGSDDNDNNLKSSLANQNTIPAPTPTPATPPALPVDPTAGLTGFDKAFAEARAAFGAGHTFQYEGQTYNTFTKEEELSLTPEQRNEFLASNNLGGSGSHGHHESGTALASNDASVSIDGDPHVRLASHDASVSVMHDDAGSVSLDNDLHHDHNVASLDDHAHDHNDNTHDLHDPGHDFDNHADVSDFT